MIAFAAACRVERRAVAEEPAATGFTVRPRWELERLEPV
jgi:hypothetical protein